MAEDESLRLRGTELSSSASRGEPDRSSRHLGGRFLGLDGLRGIAALIVVFTHCGLIFQAWAGGPRPSDMNQVEPWAKAIQHSPLHVTHAGGEAVFVFFILSGFVLVLPFLRGHRPAWVGYFPKRLLRIYLPIVGSVLLVALTMILVPRVASPQQTWWVNSHDGGLSPFGLVREALVLLGTGRYNSVLWSLKWEILFSLMLPAYVLAVRLFGRFWLAGTGAMILLSAAGFSLDNAYLEYLPMFGIGAFLAAGKDQILILAERRPIGDASMMGAAVILSMLWSTAWLPLPRLFLLVACTALVVAFMVWSPALQLSRGRVISWLGTRSFSLYLVHEPIVVSTALIFPGNPWFGLIVAWPLLLLLTEVFFRFLEDPSRRLANRVGMGATGLISRGWTALPESMRRK